MSLMSVLGTALGFSFGVVNTFNCEVIWIISISLHLYFYMKRRSTIQYANILSDFTRKDFLLSVQSKLRLGTKDLPLAPKNSTCLAFTIVDFLLFS